MRTSKAHVSLAMLLAAAISESVLADSFFDDFSTIGETRLTDEDRHGAVWQWPTR